MYYICSVNAIGIICTNVNNVSLTNFAKKLMKIHKLFQGDPDTN